MRINSYFPFVVLSGRNNTTKADFFNQIFNKMLFLDNALVVPFKRRNVFCAHGILLLSLTGSNTTTKTCNCITNVCLLSVLTFINFCIIMELSSKQCSSSEHISWEARGTYTCIGKDWCTCYQALSSSLKSYTGGANF